MPLDVISMQCISLYSVLLYAFSMLLVPTTTSLTFIDCCPADGLTLHFLESGMKLMTYSDRLGVSGNHVNLVQFACHPPMFTRPGGGEEIDQYQ